MKIPGAEEARKAVGGTPPPAGTYIMRVDRCGMSRGKPRYVIGWEVALGPHRGCMVTDGYSMDTKMGRGILIQRLERLGVTVSRDGEFDEEQLGRVVAEVLVIEKDGFTNVKGVDVSRIDQDVLDRIAAADQADADWAAGKDVDPAGATGQSTGDHNDPADDEDLPF